MPMGKVIGLVVVVIVLVAAVFFWLNKSGKESGMKTTEDSLQSMTLNIPSAMPEGGLVGSIKEAMGLGRQMQCTYESGEGDQAFQSAVVVNGEKFQSTATVNGMQVYGFFDGENQYSWTSAAKTGTKISKDCLARLSAAVQNRETDAAPRVDDLRAGFDVANNVSCSPVSSAVDMMLPTDVTFTDQCAQIEQSMQMMQEYRDKMPAGMTFPGMPAAQ